MASKRARISFSNAVSPALSNAAAAAFDKAGLTAFEKLIRARFEAIASGEQSGYAYRLWSDILRAIYRLGSLNDIREVQALMPHTRAVLLRARTLGSAVSVRSSIPDPLSARGDARDPASSQRSPPDRCRHPAKRRPACRCRCRGACLRGRRTRKAKAPGRGIVRRDLPGWSHRPACHRVGACGPCFVSSIMPESLEGWLANRLSVSPLGTCVGAVHPSDAAPARTWWKDADLHMQRRPAARPKSRTSTHKSPHIGVAIFPVDRTSSDF